MCIWFDIAITYCSLYNFFYMFQICCSKRCRITFIAFTPCVQIVITYFKGGLWGDRVYSIASILQQNTHGNKTIAWKQVKILLWSWQLIYINTYHTGRDKEEIITALFFPLKITSSNHASCKRFLQLVPGVIENQLTFHLLIQ